jgi:hypothetical protein
MNMQNEDLRRVNRELNDLGRELELQKENSARIQRDLQNKLDELYGLAARNGGKKRHRGWGEQPRSAA